MILVPRKKPTIRECISHVATVDPGVKAVIRLCSSEIPELQNEGKYDEAQLLIDGLLLLGWEGRDKER